MPASINIRAPLIHSSTSTVTRTIDKMNKLIFFYFSVVLLSLSQCTTTLAQSTSPAAPPAPSGPPNITKVLEKASQFTIFLRLLETTQVGSKINGQLKNSNDGMTVFAPSDNAFSSLQAGTLNSLTDEQKVVLDFEHSSLLFYWDFALFLKHTII